MNLLHSIKAPLVLDIETDGLNPTVIHCCVVNDEVFYDAAAFNKFLSALSPECYVVGHNAGSYDIPVLTRLWQSDFSNVTIIDTLVLSRLSNPSRDGGHSLESWGTELGFPKGDHSDWTTLTPEMVAYCKQDVKVTTQLLKRLTVDLAQFSDESIKLEHDVAKIINQQINNGWKIDQRHAMDLIATLKEKKNDLEEQVHAVFLPLPTFISKVSPKVKKDGTVSVVGLKFLGDSWVDVGGVFSRIDYPQFNLGSRQQIARWLMHYGWNPVDFTEPTKAHPKGQPKVDETVLEGVQGIPQATMIAEYLMLQKRITQVQSWLDAVEEDGRVHGYVNPIGAVTGRMTHSSPNVAQVPANNSPYGEECRACWVAEEGYSMVGCDASGLELRMLAHFMNDEAYTNEILSGDIHTANMLAAGLTDRSQAKTFIYAYLYGAGDAKIGSIVGGGAAEGAKLKAQFLKNTPALAVLRAEVEKESRKGTIKGLDGRRIHIRSSHAALNSKLQGAGAVIMKKALVLLDNHAKIWNMDYRLVGNIHDEIQAEVKEGQEDKFGRLAVSCIRAAGTYYKLNCPMDGEYKVGKSWEQTH